MPSQAAEITPGTSPSTSTSCIFYASSLGNDQNNGSAPQDQYAVRTIKKAIQLSKANCPVSATIKLVGSQYNVSDLDINTANPITVNGETKNITITSSGANKTEVKYVSPNNDDSTVTFSNEVNFNPNGTITITNIIFNNVGIRTLTRSYSTYVTGNILTNQTNHDPNDQARLVVGSFLNADAGIIKIYNNKFMFDETTSGNINEGVIIDNLSYATLLDVSNNTFNYFSYPNQYSDSNTEETKFIGIRLHQNNSQASIANNNFVTQGVSVVGKSIISANIHNFGLVSDRSVIKTTIEKNNFSKFNGIDVSVISPPVQGSESQNILIHNNIGI
ncbi:MAG: hypothetical protein WC805_02855 [Patescibacteria group bacterium]|jgi:hypothetical protein